jgi:hypothetical protein
MKVLQATSKEPCFTGITNLYHLLALYRIKNILCDKHCHRYVKSSLSVLTDATQTDVSISCINAKNITEQEDVAGYLLNSPLVSKYDLLVVHSENLDLFLPFMHRAIFIFVLDGDNGVIMHPYTKVNDCFEGILYMNDFHSVTFPNAKLTVYEQTYIRDKPYRFLVKMLYLLKNVLSSAKVIVEIGSCRNPVSHDIDHIDPRCCNDSHSTFFWCRSKCKVHTVDVNPLCETVLLKGHKEGHLVINGKLRIHTVDGLSFLEDFSKKEKIDFLFLDAWDVSPNTDYAEKHLEAYEKALDHLAETCFIAIDDTDIGSGGKGRLLIPRMINDGWLILYKGRHTVLYRGSYTNLYEKTQAPTLCLSAQH